MSLLAASSEGLTTLSDGLIAGVGCPLNGASTLYSISPNHSGLVGPSGLPSGFLTRNEGPDGRIRSRVTSGLESPRVPRSGPLPVPRRVPPEM